MTRVAAALAAVLTAAPPAAAGDWYVNINDPSCAGGSGGPSDPFCDIVDALNVAAAGDTIFVFPGKYFEQLTIAKSVTIRALPSMPVPIVDGSSTGRVITLGSNVQVEVRSMQIANGSHAQNGGGIFVPAGSSLVLRSCSVTKCFADNGGGIDNAGTLTLFNSTVSNNSATNDSGGIRNRAGGTLTAMDCVIATNRSMYGTTGVSNFVGGTMTLVRTTVSGGHTCYGSGAVGNGGNATLANCTVSFNYALYDGGGIKNSGTLAVTDSTVTSNTAAAGVGGGLHNRSGGTITIDRSTITKNGAGVGGGIYNTGVVYLGGTIVADNSVAGSFGPDLSGHFRSNGYNLIGDTNDATFSGNETGNLYNVDPRLGNLADHGGPTATHGLLAGSPAIDAGPPGAAGCRPDQRGAPRADGDCDGVKRCDIGAFEVALTLNASTSQVFPGSTLKFVTMVGLPGSLSALFVADVGGIPLFLLLDAGALDGSGQRTYSATVPAGLADLTATFLAFGFDPCTDLVATNLEVVLFR